MITDLKINEENKKRYYEQGYSDPKDGQRYLERFGVAGPSRS